MSRVPPPSRFTSLPISHLTIHLPGRATLGRVAPASTLTNGSVRTLETKYVELSRPVPRDCGRELHPVRIAYEDIEDARQIHRASCDRCTLRPRLLPPRRG